MKLFVTASELSGVFSRRCDMCTFSKRKRELWEDVGEPIDIFGGCSGLSTLLRGKDCCIWANEFHGSDKPITEITWAGRAHDRWGFDIRSGVNCGIEELGQEFLKFGAMLSYEKKKTKQKYNDISMTRSFSVWREMACDNVLSTVENDCAGEWSRLPYRQTVVIVN